MSFLSEIYSVLNGETASDAKNIYIIETTDPRSTVEEVRLYEPQRVSFTSSSNEDIIANAMVELAGTRWDQKTDAKVAMTEAVNAYIKNTHTESSWKTFGRLVELAHNKFNFDMQEELKKYNQDQIDLLDMKEAVKISGDIRAGLGGDPALRDIEVEVIDFDGPDQPQDIWKGEIKRDDEEKQTKTESADLDEGKKEKRQAWMAKAQKAVEKSGGHPGKIDWDTATHLYNTGESPEEAGKVLAKLQKEEVEGDVEELNVVESKLQKLQKLNTPKEG